MVVTKLEAKLPAEEDTVDIILEQYRTRLQTVKQRAPATLIAFDKAAQKFQRHLDLLGKTAADMEPWDLEEYLAALDYAPTTKKTHWIHLGGALRYAHPRGMLPKDPTLDVYLAPAPRLEPETIPNSELRAMKARLQCDRQWLEFHLLAFTGMRQGEVRALHWEHVDLMAGTLHVERAKGDRARYVPIHPTLGEVLVELRGEPEHFVVTTRGTSPIAYDTWLDDLRDFAPGFTAHWFRRTVTSSLLDNGVEERLVKKLLGWEEQTVMGRFYDKVSTQLLQRAVLKLYADDPI
jgi:integrase